MDNEQLQYYLGVFLLFVGVLVVVAAAVSMAITVVKQALNMVVAAQGVTENFTNLAKGLKPGAVLRELMKDPMTLAVIVGSLIIYLGLTMMNGGPWLSLFTFNDPRPEVTR